MEEKRTIFDYLAQVLTIFGFTILTIAVFCLVFGNSAKDFSTLFELGTQGIPINIIFQFLLVSVLITGVRFIFFTDTFIKKMPVWLRTICMSTVIVVIIAVFIIVFHWFPVNMWKPWVMFFISFGISFLGSYFITKIKEDIENRRMDEALRRLKEKGENKNE